MKYVFMLFLMLMLCFSATAQNDSAKVQVKLFDRIAWFGSDFKEHLFLYMDGPRILFRLNTHWKLGPTFFPTLMYNFKNGTFDTGLGAGVRIDYKRWALGIPMYRIGDDWRPAMGIGFKF